MQGKDFCTTADAVRRTGVTRKAIRVYEQKELLSVSQRTPSGYRLFTEGDLAVLRFIRQARTLGLRLDEIRSVLDLQRDGLKPCDHVRTVLDTRVAEIDAKVAELRALQRSLLEVREGAASSRDRDCGATFCHIIETATRDPA